MTTLFRKFLRSTRAVAAVTRLKASALLRTVLLQIHTARPQRRRIAILIDGDNVASSAITRLAASVVPGALTLKRVYGDFSLPAFARWRQLILKHSIVPVHAFRNTHGKNATDILMTVDAMDLLHSGAYDEFWIVSSDGDFTTLAWRIRREGLIVRGFGDSRAPQAFVEACHAFTYTNHVERPPGALKTNKALRITEVLRSAVIKCANADGWAPLTSIGAYMRGVIPGFRPGQYSFGKMSGLIRSMEFLEVVWQGDAVFARLRDHDPVPSDTDEAGRAALSETQ